MESVEVDVFHHLVDLIGIDFLEVELDDEGFAIGDLLLDVGGGVSSEVAFYAVVDAFVDEDGYEAHARDIFFGGSYLEECRKILQKAGTKIGQDSSPEEYFFRFESHIFFCLCKKKMLSF